MIGRRDNMLQLLQNAGNGPSLPYMFLPGNHEVRTHAWITLLGRRSAVQHTVLNYCTCGGLHVCHVCFESTLSASSSSFGSCAL
jgi:hypothetical protein